jgi:hypothetical protein
VSDPQTLQITLQPDGVSAPAHRVVAMASQVVGTCLRALDADDCVEPLSWGGTFGYQFKGLDLTPDGRRDSFKNWVLAKGFQDLARGVRESLEEALFFIRMFEMPSGVKTTWAAIEAEMAAIRSSASKLTFPALMGQVNASLREPMAFEAEFRSLQNVRNCLEHRGGRVAPKDIDPATGTLTLNFPRLKTFYLRGEREVEFAPGEIIDTHALGTPFGKEEVTIYIRRVTRSRVYALGEPVVIEALDFYEIAMACHLFASDVASKLPARPSADQGRNLLPVEPLNPP